MERATAGDLVDQCAQTPVVDPPLTITVKSALSGAVLAVVKCNAGDSIYTMRRAAETQCSILFSGLIFEEELLLDEETLDSCSICDHAVVVAVAVSAEEAEWIELVREKGFGLPAVPAHLQSSKPIALAAVRRNGTAIRLCCEALQWDTQIIMTAVNSDVEAKRWLKRSMSCVAVELKQKGYDMMRLKRLGFCVGELSDICCSLREFKDCRFTLAQLKDAGFSTSEMKEAGYTLTPESGFTRSNGFCPQDFLDEGYTLKSLVDHRLFTIRELRHNQISFQQLREAGITEEELWSFLGPILESLEDMNGRPGPEFKTPKQASLLLLNGLKAADLDALGFSPQIISQCESDARYQQ